MCIKSRGSDGCCVLSEPGDAWRAGLVAVADGAGDELAILNVAKGRARDPGGGPGAPDAAPGRSHAECWYVVGGGRKSGSGSFM
jgi:hypothetical protein